MIYIAHRGLTNGPDKELENHPEQIKRAISQGFDCEVDLWAFVVDNRYKLLEMSVDLDLPGYEDKDGIKLPYVVTMEKGSGTVLAIRRNWDPEDDTFQKRQHFVHYGYVPGFGFYCFGLIHLVGAFAKSGTSLIRQLVDAGTLSNLPGGFKARGLRVKGDDTPIAPGEFRDVDVPSGSIKDNLMTLPYKEPSLVLKQLLDQIVEEGRRFANTADLQISDMSANAPVGTTLAILERTLKVMSAVQARVHYALKQELQLLAKIIADYTDEDYNYEPEKGSPRAKRSDYSMVDVLPVSDPNAATLSQRVVQYQAVIQLAQSAPQIYDLPQLHRQMLDVLGIKNADKLVPLEDDQKPKDPVTENMNVLKGKPLKAGRLALLDTLLPRLKIERPPDTSKPGALDPRTLFPGSTDVWLEIGFGYGEHLAWQAAHNPTVGIIGSELAARAGALAAENFGTGLEARGGPLRGFADHGLHEFSQFVVEARQLVAALQRLSLQMERDPARFLFGDQTRGFDPSRRETSR